MGQSERSLTELGKHVAGLQDRAPEARLDREAGRARLVEMGGSRETQRFARRRAVAPRRAWFVAPMAAALLVAALVVLVTRPKDALRFDVGANEAREPGVVGAWIAAPAGEELPIRFSDGSMLRLAPGGRARVGAVGADGAELALERGALDLSVVHRDGTRWMVRVGPFQVRVVGTRFETHWDPVTEQFGVTLKEGAVTVSGPVVGEGRVVRVGESLTVSPAVGRLEVGAVSPGPAGDTPAPPVTAADVPGNAPPPVPVAAPAAPPLQAAGGAESAAAARPEHGAKEAAGQAPEGDAPGTWRSLAREARYKEALGAAEREGFDGICAAGTLADLRALGDAARLGGSSARAAQAFAALRRRFPGSPEAGAAAFMLGRMAQDQAKDYAGAAGWFTQYLSEQPGGAFAGEALGRLVEAADRQGDLASAQRTAARYLAAYPGGSYAEYARRVLARTRAPSP